MSKKIILSESKYDYKYQNIFSRIKNIEVVEGNFLTLLKLLFKKNVYYHIRYVKYKGYILTIIRLLIIYGTVKLTKSKIIWSCHNIYEHNIPSKRYNDFLRFLLSFISDFIIVFHKDLSNNLPSFANKKTVVASFGEFKDFIKNQKDENINFSNSYEIWLDENGIKGPSIISISAAKRNNLDVLIQNSININCLIIAPNIINTINLKNKKNIFFYNNNFVKKEVHDILNTTDKLIGYIGHDNISVPTSIYMYASYGIPVIVLNNQPVNSIIKQYKMGEILTEDNNIAKISQLILNNYSFYQNNCLKFLEDNSWDNSASKHSKIFED
ncbi:MAG TPA: hypothetical protein EYG89_00020 [Bacteroidia bacterium]|nr:hypothetical protein [Bacteroidia bacterium]